MAAMMKALRKMDAAKGLRIESVPVPEVGQGRICTFLGGIGGRRGGSSLP